MLEETECDGSHQQEEGLYWGKVGRLVGKDVDQLSGEVKSRGLGNSAVHPTQHLTELRHHGGKVIQQCLNRLLKDGTHRLNHLGIIQPLAQHLLDELEDLLQHNHHRVGSLWHWQLPEFRAFVIILMMTDVQCGKEVGKKPQDVDNGQLVGRIRL